jgi:pilus assembly protein FimV
LLVLEVIIRYQIRQYLLSFSIVAIIVICAAQSSFALGLGEVRVRTMLGQTFLAHVDLIGSDIENFSSVCVRARVLTMDDALLSNVNTVVNDNANRKSLTFTSKIHINEPAVKLVIDVGCGTQLHREFAILLDPPASMQGASSQIQIDPPIFNVQSLPDLVSSTKKNQDTAAPAKTKKSNRQENLDNSMSTQVVLIPVAPKLATSSDEDLVSKKKSQQSKSKKQNQAVKDVLKLSDEVLVYPPTNGLVMSDILSTQTGQELIQNMEELRAAQARMAAILRDEAPVNAEPKQDVNLNQLAELSQLRQETIALRKQALNDQLNINQLKSSKDSQLWIYILSFVLACVLGICAYMFVYIRRHVSSNNPSWWEGEPIQNSAMDHEDMEDIIDEVQDSDRQQVPNVNSIPKDNYVGKKEQHSIKNEAKYDQIDDDSSTTLNSPNSNYTPTLEETNSSIFNFFSPRGSSVKVEEISDITQEAEFWISMNDHQRAIEILSPQEKIENPDSPLPWLFLLDLYRTVNNKNKYDQLKDRFVIHFNAQIPDFEDVVDHTKDLHLEDFPHVIGQVCQLWKDEKIIPYLESLLVDDREGKRMGFELPVYRDILMVLGIAHELERLKVVVGQLQSTLTSSENAPFPNSEVVNAVDEAEIHTIEFETIDFLIPPTIKK